METDKKKCPNCGESFPRTDEYYYLFRVKGKHEVYYRTSSKCRVCSRKYKTKRDRNNGVKEMKRKNNYERKYVFKEELFSWYENIMSREIDLNKAIEFKKNILGQMIANKVRERRENGLSL